ncbi:hypothetical protein [Streptomyces sp. CAS3]
MTTADQLDHAVADPTDLITDLVIDVETELGAERIRAVITVVAGGRAESRSLAKALAMRPALLTDARSSAPRAIGDLLIKLRKVGASAIAAPVCAECGKKAANPPAQGPGLDLRNLRAGQSRVHRLRQRPTRQLPRPQGPAPMQDVSRHRRP